MKDFRVVIFCGIFALCPAACSSVNPEVNVQTANADHPTSINVNSAGNSNMNPGEPGVLPVDANNTEAADADLNAGSVLARRNARMEAMRNAARANSQPPINEAEMLKKSSRPAPDDSEFATILSKSALEVRTFKSHPQLLKVEKRTDGNNSTLKVYLRNGRVIELPGNKIPSLGTESAASILEISGAGATLHTPQPNITRAKRPKKEN